MLAQATARGVWQVSGGPANRSYVDIFLRYAVALIGPGDAGPWRPGRGDSSSDGGFVRRFATEVQPVDIVLLRTGISIIRAVGLVAGAYVYLPQFDDVNGWDLQHARRVRWCELPSEYDFGTLVFGANPPRLSRIWSAIVVDYAERFVQSPPTSWQTMPLPALPEEEPPLDDVPASLQGLVAQAHDLASLYRDQTAFGEPPTEDELVAHAVVPFLRALGWPVERIAVKWHYIDVCVFRVLPRCPATCYFLIEAKRFGAGVEGALTQAKSYVTALGVARDVVVTDGIRYRMYEASRDFAPVAYANMAHLKRSALALFGRMQRP